MGIGIFEMMILAIIALVVMGPEKFPDVAKMFIRTTRDLRGYWDDIKTDLTKEIKPVRKELDKLARYDVNQYLNPVEPKKTVAAPAPATPSVDAQNVVDPAVVEESMPYEGPKHFEQIDPAPVQPESAAEQEPAAAEPVAARNYHAEAERYPD